MISPEFLTLIFSQFNNAKESRRHPDARIQRGIPLSELRTGALGHSGEYDHGVSCKTYRIGSIRLRIVILPLLSQRPHDHTDPGG